MFFRTKSKEKIDAEQPQEESHVVVITRRTSYLPFSKVQQIFPNLPPTALCSLVEMTSFIPSDVIAITPEASSEQIAQFFDLMEDVSSSHKMKHTAEETKHIVSNQRTETDKIAAVQLTTGLKELFHCR